LVVELFYYFYIKKLHSKDKALRLIYVNAFA